MLLESDIISATGNCHFFVSRALNNFKIKSKHNLGCRFSFQILASEIGKAYCIILKLKIYLIKSGKNIPVYSTCKTPILAHNKVSLVVSVFEISAR